MKERQIALEVGPGYSPTIEFLRPEFIKGCKTVYINKYEYLNQRLRNGLGRGYSIVQADGCALPIANESVSTIYLKDVLGSINPNLYGKISPKLMECITAFSGEFSRVCKSQGHVIISEMATPPDIKVVVNAFLSNGFLIKEVHDGTKANNIFDKSIIKYAHSGMSEDYSLVFKKK